MLGRRRDRRLLRLLSPTRRSGTSSTTPASARPTRRTPASCTSRSPTRSTRTPRSPTTTAITLASATAATCARSCRACRAGCLALPSYPQVRAQMLAGVALCEVQSLNHEPDPDASRRRAEGLGRSALRSADPPLEWFELDRRGERLHATRPARARRRTLLCRADVAATLEALLPVVLAGADDARQLQRLVRRTSQTARTATSPTTTIPIRAVARLCEIVAEAARRARASARRPPPRDARRVHGRDASLASTAWTPADAAPHPTRSPSAGGSLTRLLLPLARVWRATYCGAPRGRGDDDAPRESRGALPPGPPLLAAGADLARSGASPFAFLTALPQSLRLPLHGQHHQPSTARLPLRPG